MIKVRASVIIPTYNRLLDLQRVIAVVGEQAGQLEGGIEIVVVDDGSSDGTWEWLSRRAAASGFTVLRQPNSGPAVARNRGVETAVGEIVLFLGDDTVPQSGWLAAHLEEHRLFGSRGPMATLGYTSFPPESESPFRRFINEYGAQFGYSIIEDPTEVPFNFFYTSNISLPRVILERLGGFLEDFPSAAWEDIEFAYRAVGEGLRLRYQPRARTLHYHSVQPRTFCRRQRTSGLSAAIFAGLHPELGNFLGLPRANRRPALRRLRRPLLAVFVEFGEHFEGVVPGRIYKAFLDECYLEGLAEGLHSR
ncbi:glycosyltransferase family 2 protein [bacterium]|nr:glycosyltransferase family 2 protein [bacterium]